MAVPWPAGVPYQTHISGGNVERPWRPNNRTDMEDGEIRERISTTKDVSTIRDRIMMTRAQFLVFKAWAEITLVRGTRSFTKQVWTGTGYETKECRMTDAYQASPVGTSSYAVEMTLDVVDY